MGKKKSDIYVCFTILPYKNKANKSIFQCKFCDRQYLQNATKMESHIITQCQKVPAAIRAGYTTKPGNGGGGGGGGGSGSTGGAAGITGLNLSMMNKHDDLDLNDLIRDYSDSSASEAPEQMVVNVSVPGMFRVGKSGGGGGGGRNSANSSNNNGLAITPHHHGGRGVPPPKNSPPTFSSLGYGTTSPQNFAADFNPRSMQIRAYSQLASGLNSLNNSGSSGGGGGGGGGNGNVNINGNVRKRARLDNQNSSSSSSNNGSANNNNSNSVNNNNNYYTIGGAGSAHKILIKPSHGVPAAKLPNLGGARFSSSGNNNGNSNSMASPATISVGGGGGGGGSNNATILNNRKTKPPLLNMGATITKNLGVNNNNNNNNIGGGFKGKLSREETIEIWRLLARAIYSSDVPITILDNEHWINVMRRISPTLTLPSTSVLSNALLDQEYAKISQDIEEKIEKSHFTVLECVTVPGNRVDEFTLVFYISCDDSPNPFLYKTHRISEPDGYTKDTLSKVIEDVMLDIGLNKVVAFMSSDLTDEMQKTWGILRDKFPGLVTFGCVIHGLNSILDKILSLPEIGRMIDVIKKLYNKLEKSHELKALVENVLGKKHKSPYDSDEEAASATSNNNLIDNCASSNNNNSGSNSAMKSATNINNNLNNQQNSIKGGKSGNNNNNYATRILTKWKLVGKLTTQLISEKSVYQQLLAAPDSKRVLDGLSSDSPNGKSDRSLSNHLSSESFWTSLVSLKSIIVPCLEWIDSLKPDRECSLSEVPEVFKELKSLLQTHVRNFPVDDTTKQSVQKHFLLVQTRCLNEIHFTASVLNPKQKLKGMLTDDEETVGIEFLTYFCDSRGYHSDSILTELADYKNLNGAYATEKIWNLGQTLEVPCWWKRVRGDSSLSNIAMSLARISPSCGMPDDSVVKAEYGELFDEEKTEKLAFIQYNLHKPNKAKLPKTSVVVPQPEVPKVTKEVVVVKKEAPPPAPIPAKVEKLRIKIPKKEDCESPAMDLSARLSGCSQISDEEEEDDDDDSDDEESSSVTNNSTTHHHRSNDPNVTVKREHSPTAKQEQDDTNQSSDGEDGSNKDDSSSDSDDSSSDDQSD